MHKYASYRVIVFGPLHLFLLQFLLKILHQDVLVSVLRAAYNSALHICNHSSNRQQMAVGTSHCSKMLSRGRDVNLPAAVNKDTITRGLRYSIATGNWGMQGTAGMRAGVSQVGHLSTIFANGLSRPTNSRAVWAQNWVSSPGPFFLVLASTEICLDFEVDVQQAQGTLEQFKAPQLVHNNRWPASTPAGSSSL